MDNAIASHSLTRSQAARILGTSVTTVRRLEGKDLHPQFVSGVWMHSGDEVRALQKRWLAEGRVRAPTVEQFQALVDEVQRLRAEVAAVRDLAEALDAGFADLDTKVARLAARK